MRVRLLRGDDDNTVLLVYPATRDEHCRVLDTVGCPGGSQGRSRPAGGAYVVTTAAQRERWGLADLAASGRVRVVDEAQALGLLCDGAAGLGAAEAPLAGAAAEVPPPADGRSVASALQKRRRTRRRTRRTRTRMNHTGTRRTRGDAPSRNESSAPVAPEDASWLSMPGAAGMPDSRSTADLAGAARDRAIEPDGYGDVRVSLPARDCDSSDAVCTDGRAVSRLPLTARSHPVNAGGNTFERPDPSATVQGPVGISIDNAEVEEGENASAEFVVRLSRSRASGVTGD